MNKSLPTLQARLQTVQQKADVQPNALDKNEIDTTNWISIKHRVNSVNQLVGRHSNDLNYIFDRLADALFKHVTLVSFKYQQLSGEISIVVETNSDHALNLVHQKLQDEQIFQDVLLTRKINNQTGAPNIKRFEFKMLEVAPQ